MLVRRLHWTQKTRIFRGVNHGSDANKVEHIQVAFYTFFGGKNFRWIVVPSAAAAEGSSIKAAAKELRRQCNEGPQIVGPCRIPGPL